MKNTFFLLVGLFFIIGSVLLFLSQPVNRPSSGRIPLIIGAVELQVDVADSNAERNKGLSGREELAEDEGMLFVFQSEEVQGFWMREMNFAIDIIWIDAEKRIAGVKEHAQPESYPEVFRSPRPIMYVLEVPAGFSAKHSIKTGDKINFEYKNP